MPNNFEESMNVETILDYWDEIASTNALLLDPKVLFLPVDVGGYQKAWPFLPKVDWWPICDIKTRIKRLRDFDFNILHLIYPDSYLFGQTGGTIHTACQLGKNKDNPTMVKAIWIQAFIRNLLSSRFEWWMGEPALLARQVESLFSQNKSYKVEWHHAMRQILPLKFDDFGSMKYAKPSSVKELIEMAVFSTMLCLSKYQLIEYYPKQGGCNYDPNAVEPCDVAL